MLLRYMPLEEGMMIMDEAFSKAKKIIEGYPDTKFSAAEYQRFHECIFSMCTYDSSDEKPMQLYQKFREGLEESLVSTVLPRLINIRGENLLREFIAIWSNYKVMARWLCRFFEYLDRCFTHQPVETLNDISFRCFRDMVFKKFYYRLTAATLTLINKELEGLQIDCVLLKNVVDIFVEISDNRGVNYYQDFEQFMLIEISDYYSWLASEWLLQDSSSEYVRKVFWCLNREKQGARQYLQPDTEAKIVQVVRYHLLDQIANKLMEKKQAENSGMVTYYQEILSKYAGMTLQEGNSSTTPEEWLGSACRVVYVRTEDRSLEERTDRKMVGKSITIFSCFLCILTLCLMFTFGFFNYNFHLFI